MDIINDAKQQAAKGTRRLGAADKPPDITPGTLPTVQAPVPTSVQPPSAPPQSIPIAVPPPDAPPAATPRQPIQAVHLSKEEDAQLREEMRRPIQAVHLTPAEELELVAANDPLPGDAYDPAVAAQQQEAAANAKYLARPTFERNAAVDYQRAQEGTLQDAANAFLLPGALATNKRDASQQSAVDDYINRLRPEDYVPYIINQPELRNTIADSAPQRESIFKQYVDSNNRVDYQQALSAAQLERDRRTPNSSTSDGLDWVRTIIGQRDGNRKYVAPITFNQQTQQYDTNLLGAVLYPLGVIQNTVIGGVLDARTIIRSTANLVPPQYRGFAERFLRQTPLVKQLSVAQWVLNDNKYDDGKSNIIEALRGAQYSFSDDAGEGVGIGIQAGATKTPKLPFVGEVPVNPSKLLGFAADVFVGAKVDKAVSAASKMLGIGKKTFPSVVRDATRKFDERFYQQPGKNRAALPPSAQGGALATRPAATPQLPPGVQRVTPVAVKRQLPRAPLETPVPVPRQLPPARPRNVAPAPRRILQPSRPRLPPAAQRIYPTPVATPTAAIKGGEKQLLAEVKQALSSPKQLVGTAYKQASLPAKVEAVVQHLDEVPLETVVSTLRKADNLLVDVIRKTLAADPQWWGTPIGVKLGRHLDELLDVAPAKVEPALEAAGVNVDDLKQVIADNVPTQDANAIISETLRDLPTEGTPLQTAVQRSQVARQLEAGIDDLKQQAVRTQDLTPDIGRKPIDESLLPDVDLPPLPQIEPLPMTAVSNLKAYHGSRVENLSVESIDPVLGSARNELGSGVYTYGNKAQAANPAKADVSANLPEIDGRAFGDGQLHQLELSGNVLDGKASLPQLRQLAEAVAPPELQQALRNADPSVVNILDTASETLTEEGALRFQQQFTMALRDNGVQHIKAGNITSTIDTAGARTVGVTPVKGAGADISTEVMLRNRLKMETDAAEQTGSRFLQATKADTAVAAESQALDAAQDAVEAADLKTYEAIKQSKLLDDFVPVAKPPIEKAADPAQRVADVVGKYVDNAQRSSDDYIAGIASGKVAPHKGEAFSELVRDILDGYVDDPALIAKLEGKYKKLYDQVADKIYDESYSTLLPKSVKPVATAIDDVMDEISKHPPDKVPPALQQKLDDLLDEIDDEAFDRKFAQGDQDTIRDVDNPSSPCTI